MARTQQLIQSAEGDLQQTAKVTNEAQRLDESKNQSLTVARLTVQLSQNSVSKKNTVNNEDFNSWNWISSLKDALESAVNENIFT